MSKNQKKTLKLKLKMKKRSEIVKKKIISTSFDFISKYKNIIMKHRKNCQK